MHRIPVDPHDDPAENEAILWAAGGADFEVPGEERHIVHEDDEQMGGVAPSNQQNFNRQNGAPPQDQRRGNQQRQGRGDGGENPVEQEPILDGYDRTDLIGQGAYGVVFRGVRRASGETVAIKRIPFGENNMEGGVPCAVIREISLLRELNHPNVVRLLDVIQAQDQPGGLYLVFEYVAHDLKTYMDSQQASEDPSQRHGLPKETVRSFMRQILEGVCFCHMYRVLHRDLKPHNLLISHDGTQLKLADFGLARLSALPAGLYTHEVVTLWYRAPELLLGAQRYSSAVDVWSIGCIFAEMISGYALFPGRSDIDQLFKIFQRRGTPTSDIWPAVENLPLYNREFPQWQPRLITDFVRVDCQYATDLLEKILRYDPDQRISCRAALEHPYIITAQGQQ